MCSFSTSTRRIWWHLGILEDPVSHKRFRKSKSRNVMNSLWEMTPRCFNSADGFLVNAAGQRTWRSKYFLELPSWVPMSPDEVMGWLVLWLMWTSFFLPGKTHIYTTIIDFAIAFNSLLYFSNSKVISSFLGRPTPVEWNRQSSRKEHCTHPISRLLLTAGFTVSPCRPVQYFRRFWN